MTVRFMIHLYAKSLDNFRSNVVNVLQASNPLFIIAPPKRRVQKISCFTSPYVVVYSLEVPQSSASNEYPGHTVCSHGQIREIYVRFS